MFILLNGKLGEPHGCDDRMEKRVYKYTNCEQASYYNILMFSSLFHEMHSEVTSNAKRT